MYSLTNTKEQYVQAKLDIRWIYLLNIFVFNMDPDPWIHILTLRIQDTDPVPDPAYLSV